MERWRRKYGIYDNSEDILGENCKLGKLMQFLKEIGLFEDLQKYQGKNEKEGE